MGVLVKHCPENISSYDHSQICKQGDSLEMVTVDLSFRHMERVPEQLMNMDQVTHLNLKHNFLGCVKRDENFKKLSKMNSLKSMILSENSIRLIPSSLCDLKRLTMLDLSNNHISNLPPEIGALCSLKTLLLNRNSLTSLPGSFGSLKFLEVLSLGNNNFSSVPSVIRGLEGLQKLDLSSNMLHSITSTECSILEHISHLEIQKNNIILNLSQRPPLHMLKRIKYLDFSFNTASTLDFSSLKDLEHLNVSHCSLLLLKICGYSIKVLKASHNELKEIGFDSMPMNLFKVDISNNLFQGIPDWMLHSQSISEIRASSNQLTILPNKIFDGKLPNLQTLILQKNQIIILPEVNGSSNLTCIELNNNRLSTIPSSFFSSHSKLRILNFTNNRIGSIKVHQIKTLNLEELYLSFNYLQDDVFTLIRLFQRLRILHLAYNELKVWNESFQLSSRLEVLNLSGNQLRILPYSIQNCRNLNIIQVHANSLQDVPDFSQFQYLKMLDISRNKLEKVELDKINTPSLQYLDISLNENLHIDPTKFKDLCCDKSVHMVDVTFCSRVVPSFSPYDQNYYNSDKKCSWDLGFSEIPELDGKLRVSQIRMPQFHVDQAGDESALLCICNSKDGIEATGELQKLIPQTIREEKSCPENERLYMKTTILTTIKQMKSFGFGESQDMLIAHISKVKKEKSDSNECGYILTLGSTRKIKCVLSRKGESQVVSADEMDSDNFEQERKRCCKLDKNTDSIPDPSIAKIQLTKKNDFLILANDAVWSHITHTQAINEISHFENPTVAAKKLALLASSNGCTSNISIMVLKFNFSSQEKRLQMKKNISHQYIRNGKSTLSLNSNIENYLPTLECGLGYSEPILNYDSAVEDYRLNKFDMKNVPTLIRDWSSLCSLQAQSTLELSSMPWNSEEGSETSDDMNGFSGEAYKSWEYVLEQNHKLLFTRQLQTLHKSFKQTKHRMRSADPGRWCNNHSAAAYGTICHYTKGAYPTYRGKYYYYNRLPSN